MNTVTQERIDALFTQSEIKEFIAFDKTFIMACKLPNGFVITESSSCVNPENFSEGVGREICTERIKNKLWELEGYLLSNNIDSEKRSKQMTKEEKEKLTEFMGVFKGALKDYVVKNGGDADTFDSKWDTSKYMNEIEVVDETDN